MSRNPIGLCMSFVLLSGVILGQRQLGKSQDVTISGKIVDASGAAVPNAEVRMKAADVADSRRTAKADLNGYFTLVTVPSRRYELDFTAPGFTTLHKIISVSETSLEIGNVVLEVAWTDIGGQVIAAPPLDTVASPVGTELHTSGTRTGEPYRTTICELVREPRRFDGRMVQVRAHIRKGFEVSLLSDDSCSAEIWFSRSGTTYIALSNRTTPNRPALVVRQDAEYRKMNDFLKGDYNPKNGTWVIYSVTATVTGRFDHVSKAGLDAKDQIVTGFGHLNSYESQLVLESVSDVAAVPRRRLRVSKSF